MDIKQEEEIKPQNQSFDAVLNRNDQPYVSVLPADVQKLVSIKEEAPGEWRPGVDQQDPEPLNIKKEEEELWISLDEEQLNVKEQTGATFPAVPLKSEDDEEKPLSSQLSQHQVVPASSSTDQMTAVTDGEDCGGAETIRNPGTLNTHEEDSSSSLTEDSDDYDKEGDNVNNPHFKLSVTGSNTIDGNNKRKEIRSPESGVSAVKTSRKVQKRQKSYTCDLCGRSCPHKHSLESHKIIHTGEKPFCCRDCGKSFNQKSTLTIHMRIHTGERPFCCDVCGQSFSFKISLTRHMVKHTDEKPFCCGDCGRSFSDRSTLNRHMVIHTGQKSFCCHDCGKSFNQKSSLTRHMGIHTGQKPFHCHDCGKSFTTMANVNMHMRIHTDQRPFCCGDCGQRFRRKPHLNKHMKVHRGRKPSC